MLPFAIKIGRIPSYFMTAVWASPFNIALYNSQHTSLTMLRIFH